MNHKYGYIYALIDPNTQHIRYIGQSVEPQQRLISHLWYANNKRRHRKDNWIHSVLETGKIPIMEILHKVNLVELNFWEEHYIFLYKSWGFQLVNHNLFPANTGVAYNARPKHSVVMRAKFKNDKEFADKQKKNLIKIRNNPEIEKRRIENSMKVIMTTECLKRRADTLRKRYEKPFEGYFNGTLIGKWVNHSTCSKELGINISGVTRALLGMRKQYNGYIFKYL